MLCLHHFVLFFTIAFAGPNDITDTKVEVKQTTTEEKNVTEVTEKRSDFVYPSNWGLSGVFRLRSAEGLPYQAISFGIGGEFYAVSDAPNLGFGNTNAATLAEQLFMGYSPLRNLTVSVSRRNSSTTLGDPQFVSSSLGDFNFEGEYSFQLGPSFWLAPWLDIQISSNFNNLTPSGNTLSGGIGAAATYSLFQRSGIPFYLHANLSYHTAQITGTMPSVMGVEMFYQFYRFAHLTTSLAMEIRFFDLIPFIELTHTAPFNAGLSFGNSPLKIEVGSRFTPFSNKSLAFLLGVEFGLSRGMVIGVPFTPWYQIIGQLSYTVGLTQTERKHYISTSNVNVVDRKLNISQNINFKVSSTELEDSSQGILKEIAKVVKENNVKKLLIVGHTDSTHTDEFNLKLSLGRAETVKRYLVAEGIGEEVLLTQGYGKRKPKATNATEEGRATNRRVEFFILE